MCHAGAVVEVHARTIADRLDDLVRDLAAANGISITAARGLIVEAWRSQFVPYADRPAELGPPRSSLGQLIARDVRRTRRILSDGVVLDRVRAHRRAVDRGRARVWVGR